MIKKIISKVKYMGTDEAWEGFMGHDSILLFSRIKRFYKRSSKNNKIQDSKYPPPMGHSKEKKEYINKQNAQDDRLNIFISPLKKSPDSLSNHFKKFANIFKHRFNIFHRLFSPLRKIIDGLRNDVNSQKKGGG